MGHAAAARTARWQRHGPAAYRRGGSIDARARPRSPAPDSRGPARVAGAHAKLSTNALAFAALGVVFGDIGTSPLYAIQTVFTADNQAVKPTEGDVYGVLSLVVWSVTLIVSIKFVTFILRADNQGEGG